MGKKKKKDFEIKFYEGLIKKQPNLVEALSCLGDAYTRRGFYQEGLKIDQRLARLKPDDPIVHYNLACSLSLMEDVEAAAEQLEKAVVLGYEDSSYILEDPDLENLRKSCHFEKVQKKIEKFKA